MVQFSLLARLRGGGRRGRSFGCAFLLVAFSVIPAWGQATLDDVVTAIGQLPGSLQSEAYNLGLVFGNAIGSLQVLVSALDSTAQGIYGDAQAISAGVGYLNNYAEGNRLDNQAIIDGLTDLEYALETVHDDFQGQSENGIRVYGGVVEVTGIGGGAIPVDMVGDLNVEVEFPETTPVSGGDVPSKDSSVDDLLAGDNASMGGQLESVASMESDVDNGTVDHTNTANQHDTAFDALVDKIKGIFGNLGVITLQDVTLIEGTYPKPVAYGDPVEEPYSVVWKAASDVDLANFCGLFRTFAGWVWVVCGLFAVFYWGRMIPGGMAE